MKIRLTLHACVLQKESGGREEEETAISLTGQEKSTIPAVDYIITQLPN